MNDRTLKLREANARLKREIAARQHVEEALGESEQRFRGLVESISDWIWEIDAKGVYTYASPRVKDLLGYNPEEVVGRTPFDLMPPNEAQRAAQVFWETARRREPFTRFENTNLHKDGRLVILETSGVPILDAQGNLRGYRGVDRDITKAKQEEAKLLRAMVELEQSNRDLQQFAYSASHDLQEPVRMLTSYLQALDQRADGRLDEQSQTYLRLSLDSARRMQRLIDDLLAFARVGTQARQFQPVDTQAVVDLVIGDLQRMIRETGAIVSREQLPTVTADPTLLAQLFQNLIGNAIKFHGEQPPRVHVSARDMGPAWEFHVQDNGIGIDPKHAGRLFVIFERLHNQDKYPGTGIGLAICKRVVERHGGAIWFDSEPGKGTTFHFTIPKGETAP